MTTACDWIDSDEFDRWARAHRDRLRRGYPTAGSDEWARFWDGWKAAILELRAIPDECESASIRLQQDPPRFVGDDIREFKRLVLTIRGQSRPANAPAPGSRDEAQARSRGCPECGGGGLTRRDLYVPRWDATASCGVFCRCPHGQWLWQWHQANNGPMKGVPNLQAHPELWDRDADHFSWSREPLDLGHAAIGGAGDDSIPF